MAYTIQSMEKTTTTTGKEKYNAVLKDVDSGAETKGVTIWSDYPGWINLQAGVTVYGSLVPPKDPKYGPTLYAPKPASTGTTRGAGAITRAQETKAEHIKVAQENKEVGIKLSSTIRMAVDIVTARDLGSTEDIQAEIEYWRKWFWERWDEPVDRQWPTVI